MATILNEVVLEEPPTLPVVEPGPDDSFTGAPAFPDALQIIARVRAATMETDRLAEGYLVMTAELQEWSKVSFAAQAEALPDE